MSGEYTFPTFPLLKGLPWLRNVSLWSQPPKHRQVDVRDAFLLGGDGYISARLGMRDRVSTMDRTLAPYLSSYNFGENNNFFLERVSPSRDFYPPFDFQPTESHVWRVQNTAIIITAERDKDFELVTVNAVHPRLHVILRYAALRNRTAKEIRDIGISFEASPDVPYPAAGYRSQLCPQSESRILETLEERGTIIKNAAPAPDDSFERNRYLVRGVTQGKLRGYADLYLRTDRLPPKSALEATHYLAPALDGVSDSAVSLSGNVEDELSARGIGALFQDVFDFWQSESLQRAEVSSSEPRFDELIENNAILQKTVEGVTGGFVVIDDYTGTWLRDHNGSHKFLLDIGSHEAVRSSMDRYYGLDRTHGMLLSCYPSDFEPAHPLPPEPSWENVKDWITGDVPNFRTMWYAWHFAHTGDLEYIRDRFEYMLGAFMRQRLHENSYLANYCYDETYGIGPVAVMRKGSSCDNSFIALAAAQNLARLADLLGRDDAIHLHEYAKRIHSAIEATFWLEKKKYYAMRITPEGKRDETPLSVGLLRPLWTGALSADDEHAVRSVLYTFKHLCQPNGFLKLIPTHNQTVTMAIGYLLVGLKKIGHPAVDRVRKDVLRWADPSGTFGEYLEDSPTGPKQCFEHLAHRSRIWESGLNADALLYSLTGFEPNAFEHQLTLAPSLPQGWKYFRTKRLRLGAAQISFFAERRDSGTRYSLEQSEGEPIEVTLKLSSTTRRPIRIDKRTILNDWTKNRFGIYQAKVEVFLRAGERIIIDA